MEHHAKTERITRWHGLMYSTGILLIVCGIPATVLISLLLYFTGLGIGLDRPQAMVFGGCMIGAEVIIASILLYVAKRITKRGQRNENAPMKKRTKRRLMSAELAAMLTVGLFYLAQQPSNGPNIFTLIILPFYMIGVFFSGNLHQPSEIAGYLSMYLFFFAIVYGALFICSKIGESHET